MGESSAIAETTCSPLQESAHTLKLSAESVPESTRGSQAAQRALPSLVVTIQSLAELRNELGLGHGRASTSPGAWAPRSSRLSRRPRRSRVLTRDLARPP